MALGKTKTKTEQRKTSGSEVGKQTAELLPNLLPDLLPFPVGQSFAYTLLHRAVVSGRVARMYYFTGMAGVGKAMAARWLAAQILWQRRRADSRLSPSAFAAQVEGGSYCDLIWVEPTYLVNGALVSASEVSFSQAAQLTGQVRVEQALELRRKLQEAPIGGTWVVVIDGADQINNEAGNALLKLLEDHANCCFILIGSSDQILPTIRSRAQMVRFAPLSEADCAAVVERVCPGLEQCDLLMQAMGNSPGLTVRAYQALCIIPDAARADFGKFAPTSRPAGIVQALRLANALAHLPIEVQRLLIKILQHQLWRSCDFEHAQQGRRLLAVTEQALSLLEHRVQPQSVWELLLFECVMQGASWNLDLLLEKPVELAQANAQVEPPSLLSKTRKQQSVQAAQVVQIDVQQKPDSSEEEQEKQKQEEREGLGTAQLSLF